MPGSVELSGPFFRVDPRKTFRANARLLIEAVVEEAEEKVQAAAVFRDGPEPYHLRDDIRGRVKALNGKAWALTGVVSAPNARRGFVFAPYARKLERRFHMFRRGSRAVRARRKEAEQLLKGLQ